MGLIRQFINSFKQYPTIYVTVDIHGTILVPSWSKTETYKYYPFAKKVMQIMSKRNDIKLIMWSGSHLEALIKYNNKFTEDGILFDFVNRNTECKNTELCCFDMKHYTDVGLDDKFGFNPYTDWLKLYIYFTIKRILGN